MTEFFHAYLLGFLFVCGLALGCLALLMLQYVAGGRWGLAVRRIPEAASRTLPLVALMVVPILGGMRFLYPWTHPDVAQEREVLFKHAYLNVPFFILRSVGYFAIWIAMAWLLSRWSRKQERQAPSDFRLLDRMRTLSGPGLVIYGVTMTFAAVDWIMSLTPKWFSTIYGMIVVVGQGLNALAFVIVVAFVLYRREPLRRVMTPERFHDLGKLLLTFVMLWAYVSFSQLLIVWSGNLPDEIPWYLYRFRGGWIWVGVALIALHFALPFALLLSADLKRHGSTLTAVAGLLIVMRFVDLYWLTQPDFHHGRFHIGLLDVVVPASLCGLWLSFFAWQLSRRPLLPEGDPYLDVLVDHGQARQ